MQEKHGPALTKGLDVEPGAVYGIVFAGPAIAVSKSRAAEESTKRKENDDYHGFLYKARSNSATLSMVRNAPGALLQCLHRHYRNCAVLLRPLFPSMSPANAKDFGTALARLAGRRADPPPSRGPTRPSRT